MNENRIIAHLDMDAFFASVEEKLTPRFRGQPIVVGADPKDGYGRGVVSTANYKAREYGIHSAMPISKAWQASQLAKGQGKPEAIFLTPDFGLYTTVSENVLNIIKTFSTLVEQASIDEFYVDFSHQGSMKKAKETCQTLQKKIQDQEKVTCSIGLGPNKLIAKIAANMKKPSGLTVVEPEDAEKFLEPLEIRVIPGIGPKSAELFYKKNIYTVKDLKKLSLEELENLMGKWGTDLYKKVRGQDDSSIIEHHEVKSIGEQRTFQEDSLNLSYIIEELQHYANHVFKRFKESKFQAFKTISVTVRFADFTTFSSSKSFKTPLKKDNIKQFHLESLKLLLPFLDKRKNPKLKKIRLIGVRIENLL